MKFDYDQKKVEQAVAEIKNECVKEIEQKV
jgi:hypothetical protein